MALARRVQAGHQPVHDAGRVSGPMCRSVSPGPARRPPGSRWAPFQRAHHRGADRHHPAAASGGSAGSRPPSPRELERLGQRQRASSRGSPVALSPAAWVKLAERDAPAAQLQQQLPAERAPGRRHLERPGPAGVDVLHRPQRQRPGQVGVLHRPGPGGTAPPTAPRPRDRSAPPPGAATAATPPAPPPPAPGRTAEPQAIAGRSAAGAGRSSVRWRQSPAPNSTAWKLGRRPGAAIRRSSIGLALGVAAGQRGGQGGGVVHHQQIARGGAAAAARLARRSAKRPLAGSITSSRAPSRWSGRSRAGRGRGRPRARRAVPRVHAGAPPGTVIAAPPARRHALHGGYPRGASVSARRISATSRGPRRRGIGQRRRVGVGHGVGVHAGVHLAGVDVEHADAGAGQLGRPDPPQLFQRRLRRAVGAPAGVGLDGGVGGDVHDQPAPAQHHRPGQRLGQPERRRPGSPPAPAPDPRSRCPAAAAAAPAPACWRC